MKIRKLGSATIILENCDVKIICDPWLKDGIYYGSWCNYPPIPIEHYNLSDIDYIYVSHIHPDHFDPETFKYLNKNIPVIIHKYHKKFLRMAIERLGFDVIELENGQSRNLGGSTSISIFAADDCDPSICGRMFGCINSEIKGSMQLDSLCVIDDGKHVIVNTNDCPHGIAKNTLKRVKSLYHKIDFALVGYTSASLYPHCMIDYDDTQILHGIEKSKKIGLNSGLSILKDLAPNFYMPFAGTYIIGGKYAHKNKNLPLPEIQDAVSYFQQYLDDTSLNVNPVLLNLGEYFDLNTKTASKQYTPIDPKEREQYIENVASQFPYVFETDPVPEISELCDLFEKALMRLTEKQREISFIEDTNLVFDLSDGTFACLNTAKSDFKVISKVNELDNYHRFQLDPRLLKLVLLGPKFANWNNIEIGGMLNFSRKPDIYRMDIHTLINSLHV